MSTRDTSLWSKGRTLLAEYGLKETLRMTAPFVGSRVARVFRRVSQPSLGDLDNSGRTFLSPEEVLPEVGALPGSAIGEEIGDEVKDLEREAEARANRPMAYEPNWALERNSARLLYMLVRLNRPQVLLESGVANGYSTFFLTRAIERNGVGHLHSVDVSSDVAHLLDERERKNWTLHVLDRRHLVASWKSVLARLGRIDLFLHDSDHTYRWQMCELKTVHPLLNDEGLLICDDADSSFALIDFARAQGKEPLFLIDRRKVLGVLKMPGKS